MFCQSPEFFRGTSRKHVWSSPRAVFLIPLKADHVDHLAFMCRQKIFHHIMRYTVYHIFTDRPKETFPQKICRSRSLIIPYTRISHIAIDVAHADSSSKSWKLIHSDFREIFWLCFGMAADITTPFDNSEASFKISITQEAPCQRRYHRVSFG